MRKHLFRGKCTTSKEWAKGGIMHGINGEMFIVLPLSQKDNEVTIPVDPETVGEFTGLLDKNGKRIFEGDIVSFKGMNCLIRWDDKKAGFFIGENKYWMMGGIEIEVIGNIHDMNC